MRNSVLDEHARQVICEIADAVGGEMPPLAYGPIRRALAAIWQARGAVDVEAVESRLVQLNGWVASARDRNRLRDAIQAADIL